MPIFTYFLFLFPSSLIPPVFIRIVLHSNSIAISFPLIPRVKRLHFRSYLRTRPGPGPLCSKKKKKKWKSSFIWILLSGRPINKSEKTLFIRRREVGSFVNYDVRSWRRRFNRRRFPLPLPLSLRVFAFRFWFLEVYSPYIYIHKYMYIYLYTYTLYTHTCSLQTSVPVCVCVCVCLNVRIGARTHIGYYLILSWFPALCFCRDILMTDTYEESFSREGTFNIYPRSNYPRAGTNLERVIFTFLLEATFEIQA